VNCFLHTSFFVDVRIALKRSQNGDAEVEAVELEKLSCVADAMQSVVKSFKSLTHHEMPSDIKSTVSAASMFQILFLCLELLKYSKCLI
jgi:hypothetical protein